MLSPLLCRSLCFISAFHSKFWSCRQFLSLYQPSLPRMLRASLACKLDASQGPVRQTHGVLANSTAAAVACHWQLWFLSILSLALCPIILPLAVWSVFGQPSHFGKIWRAECVDKAHFPLAVVVLYAYSTTLLLLIREFSIQVVTHQEMLIHLLQEHWYFPSFLALNKLFVSPTHSFHHHQGTLICLPVLL